MEPLQIQTLSGLLCCRLKVSMTTVIRSEDRFLPYNQDIENLVNPNNHKTSYLWEDILQPDSSDLIENFVHVERKKIYDPESKRIVDEKAEILIFLVITNSVLSENSKKQLSRKVPLQVSDPTHYWERKITRLDGYLTF